MLKFYTSGESHGQSLMGIIEGLPAGISIDREDINQELRRRQGGHGRGGRMDIESDVIEILAGVRDGKTLGSPIGFLIRNKDYDNWQDIMNPGHCLCGDEKQVVRPRPGHADYPGAMKYYHRDMRNVLERASARETAARVAVGAFCKQLLLSFNIDIYSRVLSVGDVIAKPLQVSCDNYAWIKARVNHSPLGCVDQEDADAMIKAIDRARSSGESLGGSFETGAVNVPPGIGSHVSWERKLDGRIAAALMSIPAIKAVEIGAGVENAFSPGSSVHDELFFSEDNGVYRKTNRAGGLEGGISNGEVIWARAYMKPIPTLYKPLQSINTSTWTEEKASVERSDVCAVPAAAVVGEAMLAFTIAAAFLDKFGGDSRGEIQQAFDSYRDYLKRIWKWEKI